MKTTVRVAAIQWEQLPWNGVEAFVEAVEGQVRVAAQYHPDFVLLPEHLNFSLAPVCSFRQADEALAYLASSGGTVAARLSALAHACGVHLLAGSMPTLRDGRLYNTCHYFTPDGEVFPYDKIHLTPWEKAAGFSAGDTPAVWETPLGTIGVAICYDVEFPELVRLMAERGMQLLFVPFQTDNQQGYYRVRYCAQARAVENECYVVLAGNTGMPLSNPLIDHSHAQSLVCTPCDLGFPQGGILREAAVNRPDLLIADLDLSLAKALRHTGSVHTLADRRADLYEIKTPRA